MAMLTHQSRLTCGGGMALDDAITATQCLTHVTRCEKATGQFDPELPNLNMCFTVSGFFGARNIASGHIGHRCVPMGTSWEHPKIALQLKSFC